MHSLTRCIFGSPLFLSPAGDGAGGHPGGGLCGRGGPEGARGLSVEEGHQDHQR